MQSVEGAAAVAAAAKAKEGKKMTESKESEVAVDAGLVPATVLDEGNGRYLVSYTAPADGAYIVTVDFKGTFGGPSGNIRGSPFTVNFPEGASKENNRLGGPLVWEDARELVDTASLTAKQTLEGISRDVGDGALDPLLAIKNHLSNVTAKEAEVRLKLDVAQGVLDALRTEGSRKDKELAQAQTKLDKGLGTWEDARKKAPVCKSTIAPLVKSHSASTRKEIEAFEAATADYVKKVDDNPYWKFETGFEGAMTALQQHEEKYALHQKRVERVKHLAQTFEFPQLLAETQKMMKVVADETEEMRRIWSIVKETREYFTGCREQLWANLSEY